MAVYQEMKDSGISWIGLIPNDWGIVPAKRYMEINHGSDPKTEGDIPVYGSGAGSFKSCGEFKEGPTVLLGRKGATLHIPHYISGRYWNVDTAFDVKARDDTFNLRYYYYLSICFDYKFYMSQTTLPSMTQSNYLNMKLPLPNRPVQDKITSFLDERCQQIDKVISEAKTSIEDYKQWKASIIYEAVTKGLDPDVEMKDSGVAGLKEIPYCWSISKVRNCLSMPITDGPHTTPELYGEGVPFVSAEAVSCGKGKIDFNHIRGFISEEFYQECCKKYIPALNDIYMIKSGATTGRVAIVDTEKKFTIWSPLAVFRTNLRRMIPKYMFYFLQSDVFQKQVELKWNYGTQQNIGMRVLETLKICIPPIGEQKKISDYLDKQCGTIDSLILEKESLIADLEDYKKSLIYEVVTGKRRVPYNM